MEKKYLDITISAEDMAPLHVIDQREQVAAEAKERVEFPPNANQIVIAAWYQAALTNIAEAKSLKREWFSAMVVKYAIPPAGVIDVATGKVYVEVKSEETPTA